MANDPTFLIEDADKQIAKLRTQGKDFSFNELLSMYTDKELKIAPDYQRLFRWSEDKQSRFIESLILELPLPPIYVIEVGDGQYELIDGLQRFSTYLHFRGELEAAHKGIKRGDCLALVDCDIITGLNDLKYEDLPAAFQIRLKRHTIRAEIIRKESDNRLRYHMFKRLNTGGEQLSEQEIRNCTIRLLNNRFNEFIIECSTIPAFSECTSTVATERVEKKFKEELVLRFLAYKNFRDHYVHEVDAFLTEYMEAVSEPEKSGVAFDYGAEKAVFEKTFLTLQASLGDEAFSQIDRRNRKQPFSVYHFEAFTLGIQSILSKLDPTDSAQMKALNKRCWEIKKDDQFRSITTGGGKNSRGPLNDRIQYVAERIGDWL